jgi:aconitate hydratase
MLGQPIYMLIPEVVGFKLTGKLAEGTTATDLVLRVTEMLRKPTAWSASSSSSSAPAWRTCRWPTARPSPTWRRSTAPPLAFSQWTNRRSDTCGSAGATTRSSRPSNVTASSRGCGATTPRTITYTEELALDLSTVEPSLAGPKRPQDRIALSAMKSQWHQDIEHTFGRSGGSGASGGTADSGAVAASATAVAEPVASGVAVEYDGHTFDLTDGDVVIAAITSCTNTSNPEVMIGAGLVARKAAARGLTRKPWVKTSLAPGSQVVTEYLTESGLLPDLEALGFHVVGYGCTTCIGNSGPLPEPISQAIRDHDLVACSVLSGNRNFEGRISPDVRANYLASPPLVVAYALAGTVNIDLANEPLATDRDGRDVFLKDIWPTQQEILELVQAHVSRKQFTEQYANVLEGSNEWKAIATSGGDLYPWDESSTYVQEPPFFSELTADVPPIAPVQAARCLVKVGKASPPTTSAQPVPSPPTAPRACICRNAACRSRSLTRTAAGAVTTG